MAEKFKVRVWAVLGDKNAGKSTVISNLISQRGRGQGGFRHVSLRGGGRLYLYARRMAWQEAEKGPKDVIAAVHAMGRGYVSTPGWVNVLMALRYKPDNGCPGGDEYLEAFAEQAWFIESLVLLDYDRKAHAAYHYFGAPTLELPGSSAFARDPRKHAALAGAVRNHFGWA